MYKALRVTHPITTKYLEDPIKIRTVTMEDSAIKIAVRFNFWIGSKSACGTRPAVSDGARTASGCNRANKSATKKPGSIEPGF